MTAGAPEDMDRARRRAFLLLLATCSYLFCCGGAELPTKSDESRDGHSFHRRTAPTALLQCPRPKVDLARNRHGCVEWRKACLDQGIIVSFDPDLHPTTSLGVLPTLNLSSVAYNIPSKYGIGDRYRRGSALPVPQPPVRFGSDLEEEEELRAPVFSSCTLPLLLFASYPFNPAETFRLLLDKLVALQERGFFDRRVTLVPGVPPGTRLPSYTRFWLQALSDRRVVSLSQLSSRVGPSAPSRATWEGTHVRCFERVVGCRLGAGMLGLRFHHSAQVVVRHYQPEYLARSDEFERRLLEASQVRLPPAGDPSVLRVVFVSRPPDQAPVGRTLLNQAGLLARCNAAAGPPDLPPPEWGVPYRRYLCFAHVFGEDPLMDLWLMRRVDAIVGLHGAGLVNALYMERGGSVLEVRPVGFDGRRSWANRYSRLETSSAREQPWPVFWYGIDLYDPAHQEPGLYERERKPYLSDNPLLLARDRHVRLPWPCLLHFLLNVAAVARTHGRYMSLRLSGAHYTTDQLTRAEEPGRDPHVARQLQRNLTDPHTERQLLLRIPLASSTGTDAG